MPAYYNEFDPYAAAWLRNLIAAGHIAPGDVDERSIKEVSADDLRGYTQAHFFAGIGGWSLALRLAGIADDEPVWTGSCPCQPYSAAGKRRGDADERNLWPDFFRLIRERRPPAVLGEQVASAIGHGWLDGVSADLEGEGYAVGAAVLGAHSVGAPHIRQRLFWVADAGLLGREPRKGNAGVCGAHDGAGEPAEQSGAEGASGRLADAGRRGDERGLRPAGASGSADCAQGEGDQRERCGPDAGGCGSDGWLADADRGQRAGLADGEGRQRDGQAAGWVQGDGVAEPGGRAGGLVDTLLSGLEGHAGHGDDGREPGRLDAHEAGSVAAAGDAGLLAHSDSDGRQGTEPAVAPCGGRRLADTGGAGAWSDFYVIPCLDGKARRVGSGLFPLAHGVPNRVGRLRAYGNAINPYSAREFILAWREARLLPEAA